MRNLKSSIIKVISGCIQNICRAWSRITLYWSVFLTPPRDNIIGDDSLLLSAIIMMLKKGLTRHQELGRALLPVFLKQMMIPPK
jgi:hypothetical protein